MTSSRPTALDLASVEKPVLLKCAARLYVCPSGGATLEQARRFLIELPRGCYVPPLRDPSATFELVSADPAVPGPQLDTSANPASGFDDWNRAVSALLGSLDIPDGAGFKASQADALDAAKRLAAALADWDRAERAAETDRRRIAASADGGILRDAYRSLGTVTDADFRQANPPGTDPLVTAIGLMLANEDISVRSLRLDDRASSLDQRLRTIALASGFRVREVAVLGDWWAREGAPVLVFTKDTDQPNAALWDGKRYQLHDPISGDRRPLDGASAKDLQPRGFVLYAPLPDNLTPRKAIRFALAGSGLDRRRMIATGILAVVIGLLAPVATGVIVGTAIPHSDLGLAVQMSILVVAAAIGVAAFRFGQAIATIRATTVIDQRIQAAIWDRILRLPTGFFRRFSTGDLARRALAAEEARQILTGPALSGLLSGMFAGVSFLLMFYYDTALALYGLAFTLFTIGGIALVARRQLTHELGFREAEGRVTGKTVEILAGIDKLRLAAAEERAFRNWSRVFAEQQRAHWRSGRLRAVQLVITAVMPTLGIMGMIVVAGLDSNVISLADFAAFNAAFGQFVTAAALFSLSVGLVVEAIPLLRRVAPMLQEPPEVDETRNDPGHLTGRIELRDLSFRYRRDGPAVLKDISFDIEPGEFIAIVGPSGSGKSTLLRLLLGFETPEHGSVLYDNRDLAKLDVRLVRRQIGTVLQTAQLAPGSLYENIAGAAILSDERVLDAAAQAGLADDIANMPMGLETIASEEGGTLSGGQRQRVLIARALVHRPKILFFDEATSALDNHTQDIVKRSLDALDVTRLVIAHRLSTIRHADRIVVLESGSIVETGTYDQLMEQRGAFYKLAVRQLV